MEQFEIRLVKLPAMRVASAIGYGEQPEFLAWNDLMAWVKPKDLFETTDNFFYFIQDLSCLN
jgi:hypothetical protein